MNVRDGRQSPMKIGNKTIGEKTYIIAEAGVNHNGSLERALELIQEAARAGADAIKFQTYTADELVVKGTPKFWDAEVDTGLDQYEAYKALEGFKKEWYPVLMEECEKNKIEFLSTPFSFEAADYLNSLGMKAFKVASSDMSFLPYLEHIAKFMKPILLSTGASTLDEIKEAVLAITSQGNMNIVLLHCVLKYPTPDEESQLKVINTLQKEFPFLQVGLSDHTMGLFSPLVGIGMGSVVVEKHFTLDKSLPNSADHWLSMTPEELQQLVAMARDVEKMLGNGERVVFEVEKETRKYDKRSIVTKIGIAPGTTITEDMITYKRPGTGIWPSELENVLGKKVVEFIPQDTVLQWTHLE